MIGSKELLYVIVLGPASDIVSAYLRNRDIKDHVVVVFHARSQFWPDKAVNMNIHNDIKAVQALLRSELPLTYFDTGSTLRLSIEESEANIKPWGKIGKYLHNSRVERHDAAVYDIGDFGFLVNNNWSKYETVNAPDLRWDYTYNFNVNNGPIIRVTDIDKDAVFKDFFTKLRTSTK